MSFRATFFGWQGWLFETARTAIAIDPLLVDQVGRGPRHTRIDFMFREARELTLDRLPPLDALVLSHEHEDHFNIPTLVRLDRRIPLYVSRRVSAAARGLLGELGFAVHYVDHGDTLEIGDLEVRLFGADQTAGMANFDEWDVLAYLVRQRGGAGGLFSNVDIALSGEMIDAVRDTAARDRRLLLFVAGEVSLSSGATPTAADGGHPRSTPAAPIEEVAARLRAGEGVVVRPGTVFELDGGELVRVAPEAAFLRTIPGRVARRAFALPAGAMPERPLLGTFASELDRPELEAALRELAEHMYGRHIYRYLMTLPARYAGKRTHSFVLVFLTAPDGPEWLYEYVPGACAFRAVDIDFEAAVKRYLGVVVLWVSDYLAVARGEVEPRAIHCATQEDWAIEDPGLAKVRDVLWSFYHPQRFPARVLAQYRRAVALETPDGVWRTANHVRRRPPEPATPADPAQKPRPAPRPPHEPRRPARARAKHAAGAPVSKHPRRGAHGGRRRPAA